MSDRQAATEKGTADRIEADDGGYWVRLVTKQALRREGECMLNCLALGEHGFSAGEEDLVSDSIWSLRKADGVSYMDVEVDAYGTSAQVDEAKGPKNSQPAGWSIRQLRHLVDAFRAAGSTLRIPETIALTGEDGRTWRPDKAPQDVKDAAEARKKALVTVEIATNWMTEWSQAIRDHIGPYLRTQPLARLTAEAITRELVGDGGHARGVRSVDVVNGHLIVTYSDGSIVDTGRVTGIASPTGHTGSPFRSRTSDGSRLGLHLEEQDMDGEIRSGIELNEKGVAVAYWIDPTC